MKIRVLLDEENEEVKKLIADLDAKLIDFTKFRDLTVRRYEGSLVIELNGYIGDLIPEIVELNPLGVILTAENSTNPPLEGLYRRRRANKPVTAVVDSYDKSYGMGEATKVLHIWTIQIKAPTLKAANEMLNDIRVGKLPPYKCWAPAAA